MCETERQPRKIAALVPEIKKQGQTVYKTETEIQTDIETKMHWDKYASSPMAIQTHRLKQSPKRRQTNIHKEVLNAKNEIWKENGKHVDSPNVTNNSLTCKDNIQGKHYKSTGYDKNPVMCIKVFPVNI